MAAAHGTSPLDLGRGGTLKVYKVVVEETLFVFF